MCSVIWAATPIAWPSPTTAWYRLLTERSRFVGAIPPTTTNRGRCLYLSMNSCAASCCICSPKDSCASGTSASWPIADVPPPCHFAFSCSARHHKPSKRSPQLVRTIFGAVPSAVALCSLSKGCPPIKPNPVLHRHSILLPHETTIDITKLLRVAARFLSLCLLVQQITFPTFTSSSFHRTLGYSATLLLSL